MSQPTCKGDNGDLLTCRCGGWPTGFVMRQLSDEEARSLDHLDFAVSV